MRLAACSGIAVAGWQVIDEGGRLRILLAEAREVDTGAVAQAVERSLAAACVARVPVEVELVRAIPRTALGKAPLIRQAHMASRRVGTH